MHNHQVFQSFLVGAGGITSLTLFSLGYGLLVTATSLFLHNIHNI